MKKLQIEISEIGLKILETKTRLVVNQGGTSSGKTWSILQVLIGKAIREKLHISICSISLPHLKKGALRDFILILNSMDLYKEKYHNKTDNIFRIRNSRIEFFSLDDPGKARGPRRDILFVNECNLVPFETFNQLMLRTKKQVFIDYNPADENHWIYEKVLTRTDCTFIKSTYLDNPFLDKEIIGEIERLKDTDENYWKIYGLGERGMLKSTIYENWEITDDIPEGGDIFYGLDFGYNVPAALVKCYLKDGMLLWLDELIYQSHLTNSDLIEMIKKLVPARATIYADSAEPQRIEEIRIAGFNCRPADKSVKDGIDRIKRMKVHTTRRSTNIMKERQSYKWKEDIAGNLFDEPLKFNDHIMDAIRYAVHTHCLRPSGRYNIRII
jgi:phage terminase large subunit